MPLIDTETTGGYCRMTNSNITDLTNFSRIAGANCFTLLSIVYNFKIVLPFFKIDNGYLIGPSSNRSLDLSRNSDIEIMKKHLSNEAFSKWTSCNDAAVACCLNVMSIISTRKSKYFVNILRSETF